MFHGIRWRQGGTATRDDVTAKTFVNGVPYDTTVNTDGKYYETFVSQPVRWGAGRTIDVAIQGALLNGIGRTVNFDIYERSDIYVKGAEYGFDILPAYGATIPLIDSAAVSMLNGPYYDGAAVTIASFIHADVPARFTSFNVSDGRIQMKALVRSGTRYWLEWTTDFMIWHRDNPTPLAVTQDTEWGFDLIMPATPNRFFRIVGE